MLPQTYGTLSHMYDLIPPKKPSQMPVLQEIRGMSLTASAAQMILMEAKVVSEGDVESDDKKEPTYQGSTLVSVDLTAPPFKLPSDDVFMERFCHAASHSIMLHIGLMRLSRTEAERRAHPKFVKEMRADTTFRIIDKQLLIDIDIECPLADSMGDVVLKTKSHEK